jgi:hypothetical protein
VKVARMTVGMLKAGTAVTKIDFPCNTRVNHPLQGSIYSGSTYLGVFTSNNVNQVIGTQVPFLAQEHIHN